MENEQKKLVMLLAENVTIAEESKQNPVFLSIDLKLADNSGNRNHEGVTAKFISDLINRQSEFECLPFYADVKNLLAKNYRNLGHMYDRKSASFGTTQIGSLMNFRSEADNDGVISLYATARVPKREKEVCLRLIELYEMGQLFVSFEIRYNPEHILEKDGVRFIDAHEDNAMTGIALVSVPACPDATALDMVAECNAENSEAIVAESKEFAGERGENEMNETENMNAEATEEIVNAEAQDATETVAEAEVSEETPTAVAADGDTPGSDDGDDEEEEEEEAPIADTEEEEPKARQEDAQAEVVEHSVDIHEGIHQCPETGETIHVTETMERIVETMDDPQTVIAEQNRKIAELETKIAQLNEIAERYQAIVAEQEAKALAERKATAKAFAERQGLNPADTAVAEAIEALDYTKIAELTMKLEPEAREDAPAEENKITLAGYVEFDINNDGYGGLLNRRNK